jgi:hypothetical protein
MTTHAQTRRAAAPIAHGVCAFSSKNRGKIPMAKQKKLAIAWVLVACVAAVASTKCTGPIDLYL